jgi:hypothetical protein
MSVTERLLPLARQAASAKPVQPVAQAQTAWYARNPATPLSARVCDYDPQFAIAGLLATAGKTTVGLAVVREEENHVSICLLVLSVWAAVLRRTDADKLRSESIEKQQGGGKSASPQRR